MGWGWGFFFWGGGGEGFVWFACPQGCGPIGEVSGQSHSNWSDLVQLLTIHPHLLDICGSQAIASIQGLLSRDGWVQRALPW